ncbi:MAG: dienelactone hydrolase family protein [Pseudomonadota bacterium]
MSNSLVTISAHDGGNFNAYIAMPETTPAPAIIMIQEIFGINQEMRDKCDEMARQGYITIAPDLFWRIEPGIELVDSKEDELQRAFDLFGQFDTALGVEDLASTLGFIKNHEECNGRVGCVGYCLGGYLAAAMAVETNIDASVGYYGVNIPSLLGRKNHIENPLMLHIAGNDEFVPPEAQEEIKEALKDHYAVTIHQYDGMDHAFARGQGMHYNEEAATLANSRTKEFLEAALK